MKISILIPCLNEEKTIKACVQSCLDQTKKPDEIVVVNDGSTDGTQSELEKFNGRLKVINLPEPSGSKSKAQEEGMKHIIGDIVITTDADTLLREDFVEKVIKHFDNPDVSAVAGYVKSLKNNWLTALRELDYFVGQTIFRKAQGKINSLFVIPGCAAAFRTKTLKVFLDFEHDTLTEDLDFTYKLHKLDQKIVYEPSAVCFTQDPHDIGSLINQVRRWYGGQWQNLVKHAKDIKKPNHIFEFSLLHSDAVFSSILLLVVPLLGVEIAKTVLVSTLVYSVFLGSVASFVRWRFDLLLYSPLYVFYSYLNAFIYIEQFVKEYVLRQRNLVWFTPARSKI